jgi:hypothetical protein
MKALTMDTISDIARISLAASFAVAAGLHLLTPALFRKIYQRPDYPDFSVRVMAVAPGFSSVFLLIPHTHIWGVALGALTLFVVVTEMLFHRRYTLAFLGILAMTALPVAIIAAPLS